MTPNQFKAEMDKLNPAQQRTLRGLFSGRVPTGLHVDAAISKATVTFGPVVHFVILGPRGRVISREMGVSYNA